MYIRGHKVGQVDKIHYDFTRDSAFTIDISIAKDVALPQGTQMALISDGMLGGMAIELQMASLEEADHSVIAHGSFLPTVYVPGLMESLQGELLVHVDEAIQGIDSLVAQLRGQVDGDHLDDVSDQIAEPQVVWRKLRHQPEHWDDRQRERE